LETRHRYWRSKFERWVINESEGIMEIEKKYKWMEISQDGLMKEPEDLGPYYSTTSFNGYNGFDTEEDALEQWKKLKKQEEFGVPHELVLVPVYKMSL
jgi:hypothetical protein